MIVAGVILLILCGALLIYRRFQEQRLLEISTAEASTAQALADASKYVAERLGEAGSFSRIAKVKGIAKCDSPLTSEVARQPCVYYEMSVTREYEEYRGRRSRKRQRAGKSRRGSETVASNSQRVPFWIEDATGRILVNPDHSQIDSVKVVDRFDQAEGARGAILRFGSFSVNLGNILPATPEMGSRTTLGYRLQEKLLPLEQRVYVLGEARDASGQLTIEKPREGGKPFIVSLKSEEELIGSARSTIQWLLASGVASGIAGIGLVLAGLIPLVAGR